MALDETAGRRQGSGLRGEGNRCGQAESQGGIVGIDRWAKEYASFSKSLRESNARAEGVSQITFQKGDASHLDFPDKTFDAMGSNYLYQTSQASDKNLPETPRTLKKAAASRCTTFSLAQVRRYAGFCAAAISDTGAFYHAFLFLSS